MQDKLYVVAPAYNEPENIRVFVDGWYPVIQRYDAHGESRLVVIDDGSTDNTYDILLDLAKSRPMLTLLSKPNGGHGSAVFYAYRFALEEDAQWVFQTDSDGQTDPSEFEQFWELRTDYDAILGNRSRREDGLSRKLIERVLVAIIRLAFGVGVPDSNAPFRLMKADLLRKYLPKMHEDFNLPNAILTTYFVYFHEKVKFVEITFRSRQGGTNSLNVRSIFGIGCRAIADLWLLRRRIDD